MPAPRDNKYNLAMNKFTFKLEAYWLVVFAVLLPLIGILVMVVIPNVLRALGIR